MFSLLLLLHATLATETIEIAESLKISESIWLTCKNITYQPDLMSIPVLAGIDFS